MQLLDSSISILDNGVNDFPRLAKVLQITRVCQISHCMICVENDLLSERSTLNRLQHFELISESNLHAAQSALLSEIRPEVESLLNRVSNYLDKLERREQSLIAKYDLNEGRLSRDSTGPSAFRPSSRIGKGTESGNGNKGKAMTGLQELKYKQLRQKKERLSYAVETLELQARQRERQLRMSMAAPQQYLDED